MLESALLGLAGLVGSPYNLMLMLLGVTCGTVVAILPGIGSIALLTMALPFAMTLKPYAAIALLASMHAVANTASM